MLVAFGAKWHPTPLNNMGWWMKVGMWFKSLGCVSICLVKKGYIINI